MDTNDWVKTNMFSIVLQTFHHMGLLRCFALYLHAEQGVEYYDFYNLLLSYITHADGTFLQKLFLGYEQRLRDTETGDWTHVDERFGKSGWYFEEAAFLDLIYVWDGFWPEIRPFLEQFEIPEDLFADMLRYQQFIIRRPDIRTAEADFNYDFINYFERIYNSDYAPLEKKHCHVRFRTAIEVNSWSDYGFKIILGGKRRGETIITNEKNSLTVHCT